MFPKGEHIVGALSVHPYVILSIFSCPEHKSKTIQDTDLKLHRWIISHSGEVQYTKRITLGFIILELLPLLFFILWFICLEQKSKTIQATDLKLYRRLYHIVEKWSAQEPKLCYIIFELLHFVIFHTWFYLSGAWV